MYALFQGPLVVQDDCVLAGEPGMYALPVWPSGSTAEPDASGRIVVRDPEGTVVAVEGEMFERGGGFTAEFQPADRVQAAQTQIARAEAWLGFEIPDRCLTPDVYGVRVVGDTAPLPDRALAWSQVVTRP